MRSHFRWGTSYIPRFCAGRHVQSLAFFTFQNMLAHKFLPVRPLLDLGFEQVPHFGAFQFLALLMIRRRCFQSCVTSSRYALQAAINGNI